MAVYEPLRTQENREVQHSIEEGESALACEATAACERLRAEAARHRAEEALRQQQLDDLNKLWALKAERVQVQLNDSARQAEAQEAKLFALEAQQHEKPPPGYKGLLFVQGEIFLLVGILVVLANVATTVAEFWQPEKYGTTFFWPNQFFLAFYVVELGMKTALLHCGAFFGRISEVWWQWLDLVIVVGGIFDLWLMPGLEAYGLLDSREEKSPYMQYMSFLRIARLARILKIVNAFMHWDTSWADGHRFQGFIMCCIGIASLCMGLEMDNPDLEIWPFVNMALLTIFCFEILVRLKNSGCRFFCDSNFMWNWLDFLIVIGGVLDSWVLPGMHMVASMMKKPSFASHGKLEELVQFLRLWRLLRILRIVRLVKNIQPLYVLVVGIAQAMQGMTWVVILTLTWLYLNSLIYVKLFGQGLIFGVAAPLSVTHAFSSVTQTMYVLFKAMNGDPSGWQPLFDVMPVTKVICATFMVISSWGILSILTAVVSENMFKAAEASQKEEEERKEEETSTATQERLRCLFRATDRNKDGELTEPEFENILEHTQYSAEFCEVSGLNKLDLQHLFRDLAREEKEVDNGQKVPLVTEPEFIENLERLSRPVTERSVLRIERMLHSVDRSLHAAQTLVQEVRAESTRTTTLVSACASELEARLDTKCELSTLSASLKRIEERLDAEDRGASAVQALAKQLEQRLDAADEAASLRAMVEAIQRRLDAGAAHPALQLGSKPDPRGSPPAGATSAVPSHSHSDASHSSDALPAPSGAMPAVPTQRPDDASRPSDAMQLLDFHTSPVGDAKLQVDATPSTEVEISPAEAQASARSRPCYSFDSESEAQALSSAPEAGSGAGPTAVGGEDVVAAPLHGGD